MSPPLRDSSLRPAVIKVHYGILEFFGGDYVNPWRPELAVFRTSSADEKWYKNASMLER